jgi:hypothetical protein
MADRVTEQMLRREWMQFCMNNNLPICTTDGDYIGDEWWALDRLAPGDGMVRWGIVRSAPGTSGESNPFGSRRRSTREMYDVLRFANQLPGVLRDVAAWREQERRAAMDDAFGRSER